MNDPSAVDGTPTTVGWRSIPAETVPSPIVRELPYLELKLEHPTLEPVGFGDRFFPDVIPYEFDGTPRVWYWRPAVGPSSTDPDGWELVCATTHELLGIDGLPASGPPLVTEGADGTAVVVDGTIGGDVTTNYVRSYTVPDVSVTRRMETGITVTVDGSEYALGSGERRRIRLSERRVELVESEGSPTTVSPELVVRYPGQRELHHPAMDADYRVFPSFGLDLSEIPNPISVPTEAEELDAEALADELGVDRSDRPYPERVLWQAFAYTTFDPRDDTPPELAQLETGHIVLRKGRF